MNENNNTVVSSYLPVGALLQGKYRIDRYLASGGFGNTYVATNTKFDEVVAVKEFFMKDIAFRGTDHSTVSISNVDNQEKFDNQLRKFNKEAKRIRKINNEHIVHVTDLFDENGTSYYVMDYIDGQSLTDLIKSKGCLDEKTMFDFLNQTLDALKAIHDQGIWHLDLKPSNLMIDKNGKVVIIDFGASKQMNVGGGASTTTLCYTPGYAPGEQMEQNFSKLGPWSDIYALGATMYYALVGEKPPMPSTIAEEGREALNFPAGISSFVVDLIFWMLSNRLQRPQSVADVESYIKEKGKKPAAKPGGEKKKTEKKPAETEHTVISNPRTPKAGAAKGATPKAKTAEADSNDDDDIFDSSSKKKKIAIIAAVAVVALLVILGTGNFFGGDNADSGQLAQADSIATEQDGKDTLEIELKIGDEKKHFTYVGAVENGKPQGLGRATAKDGDVYEGPFVNGKREGENGTYTSTKDGYKFEGSFENNNLKQGTYTFLNDGSYYVGTFKNNEFDKGKLYNKDGSIAQEY